MFRFACAVARSRVKLYDRIFHSKSSQWFKFINAQPCWVSWPIIALEQVHASVLRYSDFRYSKYLCGCFSFPSWVQGHSWVHDGVMPCCSIVCCSGGRIDKTNVDGRRSSWGHSETRRRCCQGAHSLWTGLCWDAAEGNFRGDRRRRGRVTGLLHSPTFSSVIGLEKARSLLHCSSMKLFQLPFICERIIDSALVGGCLLNTKMFRSGFSARKTESHSQSKILPVEKGLLIMKINK